MLVSYKRLGLIAVIWGSDERISILRISSLEVCLLVFLEWCSLNLLKSLLCASEASSERLPIGTIAFSAIVTSMD